MTSETHTFLEFSDLIGIQLECLKCGAKATRPLGHIQTYPVRCENCKEEWFIGNETGKIQFYNMLGELAKAQAWVKDMPQNSVKLRITMEIMPSVSQKSEPEP